MPEFVKRVATIIVLVSILALLFLYGTNTSLVFTIYLVTLLSFNEWLSITSKSKYYIASFFCIIVLNRLQQMDRHRFILSIFSNTSYNYDVSNIQS